MRERKTVSIPVEVIDDERLSDSEYRLLSRVCAKFGTAKFKFNEQTARLLNVNKRTFYRNVSKLVETEYLQRDSDNSTYWFSASDSVPKTAQVSAKNGTVQCQKWHREKEEERSKEEDKEYYIITDGLNNNFIKEKEYEENEKEKEIYKERERARETKEKQEKPSDKNESEPHVRYTEEYRSIIDYLNKMTGKHYSAKSRVNQGHMSARLKEGFSVEDFRRVIDRKCLEWIGTEMEKYLRPETLFSTKFDRYLNETGDIRRVGRDGWEYTVSEIPDPLDEIFGTGGGR